MSVSIGLKGVGEWLMIYQDVEVSSLHKVAKVADGQALCQVWCTFFLRAATWEKSRLWEPSGR